MLLLNCAAHQATCSASLRAIFTSRLANSNVVVFNPSAVWSVCGRGRKWRGQNSHVVQDTPAAVRVTGAQTLGAGAVLLTGLHGDLSHLKQRDERAGLTIRGAHSAFHTSMLGYLAPADTVLMAAMLDLNHVCVGELKVELVCIDPNHTVLICEIFLVPLSSLSGLQWSCRQEAHAWETQLLILILFP